MVMSHQTVLGLYLVGLLLSVGLHCVDAEEKTEPSKQSGNPGVQPVAAAQVTGRSTVVKIFEEPDCKSDIQRICKDDIRNNFAVLECFQNERRDIQEIVSDKCSHLLWNYKVNLTKSGRIEELAKSVCEGELNQFPDCKELSTPGHTISCLTEVVEQLRDDRCRQYLLRMAAIVFSDYRLVENMVNDCKDEINTFKCGRVQKLQDANPHSQGSTIECLTKNARELGRECHKQILRLAEIQADDFHLDRPLFFACREDREKFCDNVRAGEGRVYKCLMKHKMERRMSKECVDQLSRRQQLIAQDYHVSRGLVRACRSAITENSCRKGSSDDNHDVKLSRILLCLENAMKNGKNLENNCKEEMLSHRRMLMEDYKLSPNLMVHCKNEIETFCGGGVETGGRTLHCLMKQIRNHNHRKQISDTCRREMSTLMKEADVGEDWRADPVLYEACLPMVESSCKDIRGGNARVLRCLMRHLNSPEMPSACEAALLEIQYFVSRDWNLDPQLHNACVDEAVKLCNAKKDWADTSTNVERGVHVLPCLFRYVYHPNKDLRLSTNCIHEVQRVMHERAAYVDLLPEIEMVCMEHLAQLCSTHTGPGEEIACLQDNLEKLNQECKEVIGNYTAAEAKDTGLNAQLTLQCASVVPQICKSESQQPVGSEDGGLLDCLIRHKNVEVMGPYPKCKAVIEHFQLLALKDYTFSPRFKEACSPDVAKFCNKPKPKNKADVIECLSLQVRNDILADNRHQVSKPCRQQLRQQLFQRHENFRLDPRLQDGCEGDARKFCKNVKRGRGAVLECLRDHRRNLTSICHKLIFLREQEEHLDPGTDVVLVTACRKMIEQHCRAEDSGKLLFCLRMHKEELNFDSRCRLVVMRRMVEQTTDSRLNPELRKACRQDMAKFCLSIFEEQQNSQTELDLNGKLTECLKEQLPGSKLSSACRHQVTSMARLAALDYKFDPILLAKCEDDMRVLCPEYLNNDDRGHMEECLKLKFDANILKPECQLHIAHVIEIQRADIHVDPVLNAVCGVDDNKYCEGKERGHHIVCLYDVLERNPNALKTECREKLRERREMYQVALKVSKLSSLEDLVRQVSISPERNYIILSLITIIGIIFIIGLFCGRSTRRYKLLKDR
ncbi:Golgi apparatus protein 1-like [Macrobrachium nipponense]|uniref:Golgi apparatus protein 1-like n=1 Tax=Macrobrachium nipponense TaxID=159736 RepID=UPI0030C7BEDF